MLQLVLPIAGLLASTFLLLAGNGLAGVLLPVRASLEGWSPVIIGWIGFGYALSFTAGCIVVPRMVRRVGHVRVYAVLASVLGMSVLLHALFVNGIAWIVFRGLAGFSLAGAYMVVESWLNERASNEARGQVFSIYMVVNMVGLMAGQFMLAASSPATTTLFMLAALLYAAAVIPTGMTNAVSPRPLNTVSINLRKLFVNSPLAFVGVAVTGFVFGAWSFQAPVYGQQSGLSEVQIATMMATAMVGGTVFQFPLGRISDKMDRRYVIGGLTAFGLVVSVILAIASPLPAAPLFVMMFLFGGVLMPLYSLVAAHANDHASSDDFVEISSGLLIVYGIGSMAGPVLAGLMMSLTGTNGFFLTLAVSYLALSGYVIWRMRQRRAVPVEEMTDYVYTVAPEQTPETIQLDPRADEAA